MAGNRIKCKNHGKYSYCTKSNENFLGREVIDFFDFFIFGLRLYIKNIGFGRNHLES